MAVLKSQINAGSEEFRSNAAAMQRLIAELVGRRVSSYLGAVMPTLRGSCVLIDVGANVSPKPEHLFQYGVMGSIFAKHILQRPQPTIDHHVGPIQTDARHIGRRPAGESARCSVR